MKALIWIVIIAGFVGCSRIDRWSISAVRDISDKDYQRVSVDVMARDGVPWPLAMSVSAVDETKKHIESRMPRWTAKQISPNLVTFEFVQPRSAETKSCVLNLKITAKGHENLYVKHMLGPKSTEAAAPLPGR